MPSCPACVITPELRAPASAPKETLKGEGEEGFYGMIKLASVEMIGVPAAAVLNAALEVVFLCSPVWCENRTLVVICCCVGC